MNYSELIDKYVPADDVFLFNTGCAQKAWLLLGCRYMDEIKNAPICSLGAERSERFARRRLQRLGSGENADGKARRHMVLLCLRA